MTDTDLNLKIEEKTGADFSSSREFGGFSRCSTTTDDCSRNVVEWMRRIESIKLAWSTNVHARSTDSQPNYNGHVFMCCVHECPNVIRRPNQNNNNEKSQHEHTFNGNMKRDEFLLNNSFLEAWATRAWLSSFWNDTFESTRKRERKDSASHAPGMGTFVTFLKAFLLCHVYSWDAAHWIHVNVRHWK